MEKQNFKEMKIDEALNLDFNNISLKRDGLLLHWVDKQLISNRDCIRNDRFPHIAKLLNKFEIDNVIGEVYIPNGNIFNITSKVNWRNARYMIFDIKTSQSIEQKRQIIREIVKRINSPSITEPLYFATIREGWAYVVENNGEGLVAKDSNFEIYKIKKLNEAKARIVGYEKGLQKGAFILENGGKVSATSEAFVEKYRRLSNGNEVYADIRYQFMTPDGKLFQPRLMDIFILT